MKRINEIVASVEELISTKGTKYWKLATESGHTFNTFDSKLYEGLEKGDKVNIDYEEKEVGDKRFWNPQSVQKFTEIKDASPAQTVFTEAKTESEERTKAKELFEWCVKTVEDAYQNKISGMPEAVQSVNCLLMSIDKRMK